MCLLYLLNGEPNHRRYEIMNAAAIKRLIEVAAPLLIQVALLVVEAIGESKAKRADG
jgi:hypothetical protein